MEDETCYIAHPFNSRFIVRAWELELNKRFPRLKTINPFFHKESTEVWVEDDVSSDDYYRRLNPSSVVENDINLISKCDSVIVIINGELSYGTIQEMVYAFIENKNIYLICTTGHHAHPWLKYHASEIYTSFEEFEEELANAEFREA